MKLIRSTIGFLSGVASALIIGLTPVSASAAGTAILAVSPSGGTYTTGSTFNVTISEDSGANDVDSARAQLTYNAASLQVVGFSTSANPFTTCVTPASAAGGAITTGDCALLGAKKQGKQTLGVVTFKVLAGSGASTLAFSSSSQLVNNGVDLTWSPVNGTYNYAVPAPAPAPTKSKPVVKTQTTTTTAAAPATTTPTPEVKAAEVKTEAPKKAEVAVVASKKNTNFLPYVLVIAVAAVAIFFGRRALLKPATQPAKKYVAKKPAPGTKQTRR